VPFTFKLFKDRRQGREAVLYGTLVSKSGPTTKTTIHTVSRGRLRWRNQTKENLPLPPPDRKLIGRQVEGGDLKKPPKQTCVPFVGRRKQLFVKPAGDNTAQKQVAAFCTERIWCIGSPIAPMPLRLLIQKKREPASRSTRPILLRCE